MNKRKIIFIILILVVLIVPSVAYEYDTFPHSTSVMPLEKAYELLNNSTDSTNTTFNLSYLGSRESVIAGVDAPKFRSSTVYFGLLLFAIKTSEKINAPLTGMTYQINNVYVSYNGSNLAELPHPKETIYMDSGIENVYTYEYGVSGNFTLTFYVQIIPIGVIGPFHFDGNAVTERVNINVHVKN
ncbi:MAG: hypothetical protein ACP5TI_03370 [Thermoprotei archaeon]